MDLNAILKELVLNDLFADQICKIPSNRARHSDLQCRPDPGLLITQAQQVLG